MAKPFDSAAARRMMEQQQKYLRRLHTFADYAADCRTKVQTAAAAMAALEAQKLLQDISVEEINRGKKGFRIKTLQEGGITNIAALLKAPAGRIAAINGIGSETAKQMKAAAEEIAETTRQTVKIRLSTDEKTTEATQLVNAIFKYKQIRAAAEVCDGLLQTDGATAEKAITDLSAAIGGLKWLFASKAKKQSAVDAFGQLQDIAESDFAQQADTCLKSYDAAKRTFSVDGWQDFTENSVAYFNILEELVPTATGNDDAVYGLPQELAEAVQEVQFLPDGLRCELRRYQQWGVKYALRQKRILLGDEMGLGKTVQAIATMVSLRNQGATHFLVVCPASVMTNWCREIEKMSDLAVQEIHGSDRGEELQNWLENGGVAVTTFETTGFVKLDADFRFSALVVDEAHYIKNPAAQRTVNVKRICGHAERLLFMTGTALENNVEEMIALLDILQPDIARQVQGMAFLSSAPQFREAVAPVYYRRKREDVLTELPELTESREWCELKPAEEAVYEAAVLGKHYADARRVSWNVENAEDSSKASRLLEIVEEAQSEGRKIIVFSFFLDTIQRVTQLLGDRCMEPINGSVSPQHRQEIVDAFNNAPAGSVLAAQIQSGGTGLNIQSASVVILCEPQFKPSIENQAVSRAYRMGQTRNVLVYRLLCQDTVDEKIVSLLETKQSIFDAFADRSVAAETTEVDEATFGTIMAEETARIRAKHGE